MDSKEREREKAFENEGAFKTSDLSQPGGDSDCHATGWNVEHYSPMACWGVPLQSPQLPETFLHVCPCLHDGSDQPGPLPGHHEASSYEKQWQAWAVHDWLGLAPQWYLCWTTGKPLS